MKPKRVKERTQIDKKESEEIIVLKSQLARALADYANLQKRVERDRETLSRVVGLGLVSQILGALDIFETAQNHLNDPGLAMGIAQLQQILKENNLEEIIVKNGDEFKESDHEAIESLETDDQDLKGKVAKLAMKGWKYTDGHVLRHAKVKVYAK